MVLSHWAMPVGIFWGRLWALITTKVMVVAKCAKVAGPTDAPITTEAPCVDKWSNCPEMAEEKCYQTEIGEGCAKSCGKCPGKDKTNSN